MKKKKKKKKRQDQMKKKRQDQMKKKKTRSNEKKKDKIKWKKKKNSYTKDLSQILKMIRVNIYFKQKIKHFQKYKFKKTLNKNEDKNI